MAATLLNTKAALDGKTVMVLETAETITALKTFDRDPNAPFAVTASSAVVTNLDADKLDGLEATAFARLATASAFTADQTFNDSVKVTLGTGGDADLYYDGTHVYLNTRVVGTGDFRVLGGGITIPAVAKLYLDGGGDTYFVESSADNLDVYVGAAQTGRFKTTAWNPILDVQIEATKKLYFDGGGNTYLVESSADTLSVYVGAAQTGRFLTTAWNPLLDVQLEATKKLYFDGGGDTYGVESAANQLDFISGGSGGVRLTSGATSWSAISDERLKTIIEPITDGGAKLLQLRPVIGRYQTDDPTRRRSFLLGQDVQRVLPEAVTTDAAGWLNLSYTDVVPLLVAAGQDHEARLKALESQ